VASVHSSFTTLKPPADPVSPRDATYVTDYDFLLRKRRYGA